MLNMNLLEEKEVGFGDSPLVHLDTKKANEYGWEPKISIEDGSIRDTVKYLLSEDSRRFR